MSDSLSNGATRVARAAVMMMLSSWLVDFALVLVRMMRSPSADVEPLELSFSYLFLLALGIAAACIGGGTVVVELYRTWIDRRSSRC